MVAWPGSSDGARRRPAWGAWNCTIVSPKRITSPSRSSRSPSTRSPLRKEPLRDHRVDDQPAVAGAAQLGVTARDLGVPTQPHVAVLLAAHARGGALQVDHVPPAGRLAEHQEGAALALVADAVVQQGVRARQLAGLREGDAELQRQVAPCRVVLRGERERALQQLDRRLDVLARERAAPRGAQPRGGAGRQLAAALVHRPELGQVRAGPLEVVAEDLLVLPRPLARRLAPASRRNRSCRSARAALRMPW